MTKIYTLIFSLFFILSATHADELINEKFRDGNQPSGWTITDVTFTTSASGYARFLGSTGILTSPAYDWSNYENINIQFKVAKFGTGTDGPITVQISNDGGDNWTAFSEVSPTPTSSTYKSANIDVPNTVSLTSQTLIRFTSETSPSDKRFRDLVVTGDLKATCASPTTAVSDFINQTPTSTNSIELTWTSGNGAGRVIVMNTSASITDLAGGANPTASTTYSGSGEQVVYNGIGSGPITITGLLPNTSYYFKGFEYCSPDRSYNVSGHVDELQTATSLNSITTNTQSFGPFCNGTSNNLSVSFSSSGTFIDDFKVQLSDSLGVFSSNLNDNIIGSGSASPILAVLPALIGRGTEYRVRVVNDNPLTIGNDNDADIEVIATPTKPQVSTPINICEGTELKIAGAGSADAQSYTFWDAAIGGSQLTNVSGDTLIIQSNTSQGTYFYYIQAENGACVSERQEIEVVIQAAPPLPVGTFVVANPSCGPASIQFNSGYYFQLNSEDTSTSYPTSGPFVLNASGYIYVRAKVGFCWSEALASDSIQIISPIQINTQPTNLTIEEGASGQFTIDADNTTYQWQVNDGCGWSDISGANSNQLTISNASLDQDGYQYRVLLSGESPCADVTSNVVSLSVTPAVLTDELWSNPITGASSTILSPYTNGQNVASNLSVSGLILEGASKTAANDRFNSNQWSESFDSSLYFSWTLTPNSGYEMSVGELNVDLQSSKSGPDSIIVRTSMDNFTSNIFTSSHPQSANSESYVIPINYNNSEDPLEIRLYALGVNNPGGTFSVNDFQITGVVSTACVPPVITDQPHDLSGCFNQFSVGVASHTATYQWQRFDILQNKWKNIVTCDGNYSGAQTSSLSLLGNLSPFDQNKYRVKITDGGCSTLSDEATFHVAPELALSNNAGVLNLSQSCDYNGWTYYTDNNQIGKYLFAINWNPSGPITSANLDAKNSAAVSLSLDNNYYSNEAIVDGKAYATYTMKRYWNVNTSTPIDEPVNVQFLYKQEEVDEIVQAAQNYQTTQHADRYEGFAWFKIVGQDFQPIPTIVTPINIMNSIPLENQYAGMEHNGFKIAQFNGIQSFSGGTGATGAGGIGNPLPVELIYFNAVCDGGIPVFNWATASELNSDKFVVEGSQDGISFEEIGTVKASGNSNVLKTYTLKSQGQLYASYYRLKQIDFDGTEKTYKIIQAPCQYHSDAIAAYYSSQESGIIVDYTSTNDKKSDYRLLSINGQIVTQGEKDIAQGRQRWTIPTQKLARGIYILTIGDESDRNTVKIAVY